ncbi:MAG: alpha/beta fold hydrolase [Methylomonas sp.]|nr:alpha/beta fold hydrolase [Methylomonas sp.]
MMAVELVFESYGEECAKPLIILHGFLASSRNWRTVAKRLAEKQQVYVLDMRNHGASPHHEVMDYPVMADDVIRFMDGLGLHKAHILGHSMGGKVAMCIALTRPERIESLMVADIAPVAYTHSFDVMIQALKQLPLDKLNNRKQAEQFLADAIPDIGFRQFLLQNLQLKDSAYYWRVNLDFIQRNANHIVGFPAVFKQAFREKALFIAGQHSAYITPESVAGLFPDAEIVEIPGAGHWLYVEAPDAFCQIVSDWMTCAS